MSYDQTQPIELPEEAVRFNGSGGEYFRIWIVNLLLTILTFGIYGAWAKVRRMQYFYRNTELAGASFDYHGNPVAILKGRIIALGLFLAYSSSRNISLGAFMMTALFIALIMPWLLRNALRFRLHNSSYRGLRLRFDGSQAGAYKTFLGYGVLALFTFYLAAPLFHQRLKQYQHGNAHFGRTAFSFSANVGQFYRAYLLIALLLIGAFVLAGAQFGIAFSHLQHLNQKPNPIALASAMFLGALIIFVSMLMIGPMWQARIQNLVWNNTTLGSHKFRSDVSAWKLFTIYVTNFVGVVFTFGLFTPWAMVRLARYRAQTITLIPATSLDEFVADQEQEVSAAGEETTEFFDIDIGL